QPHSLADLDMGSRTDRVWDRLAPRAALFRAGDPLDLALAPHPRIIGPHLQAGTDQHDPERALPLQAMADHQPVALLKYMQRDRRAGEQHCIKREERQLLNHKRLFSVTS